MTREDWRKRGWLNRAARRQSWQGPIAAFWPNSGSGRHPHRRRRNLDRRPKRRRRQRRQAALRGIVIEKLGDLAEKSISAEQPHRHRDSPGMEVCKPWIGSKRCLKIWICQLRGKYAPLMDRRILST